MKIMMNKLDKKYCAIAIDGPAGAGKTTLAKELAKEYGFTYVDTGKMFRVIAFAVLKMCRRSDAALEDKVFLKGLLDKLTLSFVGTAVEIGIKDGEHRVVEDAELRTEEISFAASTVSKEPVVRAALLTLQRDIAEKANVVMEGRDIGTVVLPNATVKFFLTANPETRADRRVKQLIEKGEKADYNTVYEQLVARDKQDSERETAPLVQAADAILIDSTELTLDEVKAVMMDNIETRAGIKKAY